MSIARYKWAGNFTDADLKAQIPTGFTAAIQQIGPDVFVDIEVLPQLTGSKEDLDEYMATLGWAFLAEDPTTPTNSIGCAVSVYDATGGQVFTGMVPVIFDTVSKNMSTGLYTFDPVAGTIEVLEAGTYEVSFDASFNTSSSNRVTARSYLTKNGVFVPGTNAYSYHRNASNGLATGSMSIAVDLAVNDVIGVEGERLGTSGTMLTVVSGSRLNLKKIA